MTAGTALGVALLIGVGVPVLAVLAEVWRAWLRRRRAAAWREIHGRVRDGLGPGEET